METYSREFSYRSGLPVIFEADMKLPEMSDVISITLYRVLQEALTNVIKHAHATQVWVDVSIEENTIALTIQDNGIGILTPSDAAKNGIGITGLRERLTLVGGKLEISSPTTKGTIISAQLRLEETPKAREKL